MAITATERSQIVELAVLMFNAAPGAEYLSQIVSVYEANGRSLQTLAGILGGTSVYAALNPNTQTAEAFADAFLTPLGLQADSLARDFIIAKMNAGVSKGAIVYEAYAALNSVPDSANNQYSAANAILNNKVAVATYYSVDRGIAATDLASLQTALSGVTADPASVTSAKAAIDATIDFTLMASAASVNEGSSITVHLTNGAPNTEYVLRVDSAHAADVGAQLTMVTTDANGTAHATITVAADRTTEGAETLTISVVGQASVSTTVTVNDTSMDNTAPAITAEATLAVNEGKSATFNLAAADAEGDAVTLSAAAANGTLVDNGNGTYTYTPNAGFSGSDTITVTAVDALNATSTQTIAVTVDPNDAPIAQAGGDATNEGGATVSGQLVATDADSGDTLTFSLDAAVEGLTLNADGSYTFNPAANTAANALVYSDAPLAIVANYTVTDALGATSQNTLTITVTPKPLTFTLTKAGTSVQEGASQVYTVTASEAVTSATDVVFTLLPGDGAAGNTGTGNTNTADFATGSFNPLTATIAAGSSTATFTVTPVNDATTELPEAFTVQAQVGGSTLTLGGTTVDATTAGGVGQTFTLTTSIDTMPGLIGSANSAGTDGNDTIVALVDAVATANTTLNALDQINGGLGTNVMNLNFVGSADTTDTTDSLDAIPGGVTISNVQTLNVRAAGNVGDLTGTAAVFDVSGISGLTSLNVALAREVNTKAAATTAVNVSGATAAVKVDGGASQTVSAGTDTTLLGSKGNATVSGVTGAVTVDGAKDVSVTVGTADKAITIGGTTVNAGTITVTDTSQGTGAVTIDGGTDVTVNLTAANGAGAVTAGAVKVGDTTAANVVADTPTGVVSVTQNLNSDGTGGTLTGSAITVEGGTSATVIVNAVNNAKAATSDEDIAVGAITVNSGGATKTVTVEQNATVTTKSVAASGGTTETASVKFGALKAGDTVTISVNNDAVADATELTFKASKDLTAAEVAAAFANLVDLDTQSASGTGNGYYTGALSLWTSAAASGDTVVFTSTTAVTDMANLQAVLTNTSGSSTAPVVTTTAGAVNTVAADSSLNVVTNGAVTVADSATASIETVTVKGYAAGSAINGTSKLATLNLSNAASGADMTVADTAATLALTLSGVGSSSTDAVVTLTAAPTTLNVTSTGKNYVDLNATATTTLNVSGTGVLDVDSGTLGGGLTTVSVTGAAGLILNLGEAATLTSVNTSGTTGAVTSTIDGSKATYTGGAGVDTVALSASVVGKAIALGAGNDIVDGTLATLTGTFTLDAGDGTDTLVLSETQAAALSGDAAFEAKMSGFEKLSIGLTSAARTVDLSNLDDINYVVSQGTAVGVLTLNKFGANGTLELQANNGGGIAASLADATGSADSFNLVLSSATALTGGTVTVANVESVAITSDDTNTTAHVNTLTLAATAAKSVTVAGDGGLNLTVTGNAALTSVDANAMTGALTINADSALALTVTGGSGNDLLTATGSGDTLIGGAGMDVLTGANLTTLTGGAGNDIFVMNKPSNVNSYSSITDLSSGDVIDFSNATAVFNKSAVVLAATAVFQDYANAAVNALGADADDIAWFQYGGDTYIVQSGNGTAADDFVNGSDAIIKIVGLVDLSTASYNLTNGTLQIA